MEALSWALTAAAVLLLAYALRVLMQDPDPDKPGQKPRLGCMFLFTACLFWSLAAHQWLGGWLDAFRLGTGIFLATPAIGALKRPHGSRLFLGVVGLVLGIVLAGPVVKDLLTGAPEAEAEAAGLQQELDSLKEKEADLEAIVSGWEEEELTLSAALTTGQHADFSALQADPAAMTDLARLAERRELIAMGRTRLTQLQAAIARVEERISTSGAEAEASELSELLGLEGMAPTPADLSPVEEYARQKQLQALFESIGQ